MCPDLAQSRHFNKMLSCGETIRNTIHYKAEKHFHSLGCFSLKGNCVHGASVLSMNSSSGFVKNALYSIVKKNTQTQHNSPKPLCQLAFCLNL